MWDRIRIGNVIGTEIRSGSRDGIGISFTLALRKESGFGWYSAKVELGLKFGLGASLDLRSSLGWE